MPSSRKISKTPAKKMVVAKKVASSKKTISIKPVKQAKPVKLKQVTVKKAKGMKTPKEIQPPTPQFEVKKTDPALILPFVEEISGDRGLTVIKAIGDGAIDEKIEEKTQFKMAEIRHVLNVLHNHGVVEYSRVKNLDTGWFTYTWSVNTDRALSNYLTKKKYEYEELRTKLNSENTLVYECKGGCCKLPFDEAFDTKFKCPTCEKKLAFTDNKDELKSLENKISSLQQILERKN